MQIPSSQVSYRKRIGTSKAGDVYGIGTIGGLHLVVAATRGGGFSTLGAGSHRGIARHIAKKFDSSVEFDELNKSETLEFRHFEDLLPGYEELTQQLRDHG